MSEQEWKAKDPLRIRCPQCGAPAGRRCIENLKSKPKAHAARVRAVRPLPRKKP